MNNEKLDWEQSPDDRPLQLREQDTDWKRWFLSKPYRPLYSRVYLEFRLYKDFSLGIFDHWLRHGSDLVHLWMDESYPVSIISEGGIFTGMTGGKIPTANKCSSLPTRAPEGRSSCGSRIWRREFH